MNNKLQTYCLLSLIGMSLFCFSTYVNAAPTGEIIFVHPNAEGEIWISNVVGTNARKLFRHTFHNIDKIEVQKDGDYVLAVVDKPIENNPIVINNVNVGAVGKSRTEVFLLDRKNPNKKAKDITLGRFEAIRDADITNTGDVIIFAPPMFLLFKREQLTQPEPEAEHIMDLPKPEISNFQCSPNGTHIAYVKPSGGSEGDLFLLDIATKDIFRIAENVRYGTLAFSPDGKQIAFNMDVKKDGNSFGTGIAVAPVQPNAEIEIIHIKEGFKFGVESWTPDGKYIAYWSYRHRWFVINNIELWRSLRNFVVPATGGEPEQILITIKNTVRELDWIQQTYPVEPGNSLVTTWGKLKSE